MRKAEIAKQWARQSGLSQAEAADRLDRAVRQIIAKLRKEGEAPLPGVGKFLRVGGGIVVFEREEGKRGV
jgi:nucleoid DNA-binding protein